MLRNCQAQLKKYTILSLDNIYYLEVILSIIMNFRVDKLSRIYLKYDKYLNEDNRDSRYYDLIFNPNNWEINEYGNFLDSVDKTPDKYKCFLTPHPEEEISQPEWKSFKLKGYDAGFLLHYVGKGKVDICNLHNNSPLRGISNLLLTFAKRQGGTMLDNYTGFLGDKYQENGFDVYSKDKWSDYYRPNDWRKDLFGEPDVEYRTYTSHNKKYNNKEGYRNHFNKKMDKAFPGHNVKEERIRQIIKETIQKYLG